MDNKTRWLLGSVAVNAMLAVGLVVALVQPARLQSPVTSSVSMPADESTAPVGKRGLRATEQALRSAGYSDEEARHGAYLIRAAGPSSAAPYEYWKPALAREAAEQISDYQHSEAVRSALVKEYGLQAKADAAFKAAFHPYARELPMLSSDEQMRLQALRVERLKASEGRAFAPAATTKDAPEAVMAGQLESDKRFEFQLRESVMARALTATGFDFDEREFRDVFRILAGSSPDQLTQSFAAVGQATRNEATMREVERVLGAARYEQFRRARDPRYALVRRIGVARGINAATIDQVYAILTEGRETPSGVSASRIPGSGKEQKLVALLGKETAAEVMRAYAGPGWSLPSGPSAGGSASSSFAGQNAFAGRSAFGNQPYRMPCAAGVQ